MLKKSTQNKKLHFFLFLPITEIHLAFMLDASFRLLLFGWQALLQLLPRVEVARLQVLAQTNRTLGIGVYNVPRTLI